MLKKSRWVIRCHECVLRPSELNSFWWRKFVSLIVNLIIFSCFLIYHVITIVFIYESCYMSHGIKITYFDEKTKKIVFIRENWLLFLYIHICVVIPNPHMYDSYNMTHVTRSFFQENIVMIYQNPLIRDITWLRRRIQNLISDLKSLFNKLHFDIHIMMIDHVSQLLEAEVPKLEF